MEALSEATQRIDRREKLSAYTQIPSLQEHLRLSQSRVEAELHRREAAGCKTLHFDAGAVHVGCLEVPLAIIYQDVPLPAGEGAS